MKQPLRGLWVPLLTPMDHGAFDRESLLRLMQSIEPFVDGYLPCLTTGEGAALAFETWRAVVTATVSATRKPVYAGILKSTNELPAYLAAARELGCAGIVLPIREVESILNKRQTHLPIMLYNTEDQSTSDLETIVQLDRFDQVVAMKDSSGNDAFFAALLSKKRAGELSLGIFQGLEFKLAQSAGADGFVLALPNIEPALCRTMLDTPTESTNRQILSFVDRYGLRGHTWQAELKAELTERGVFQSNELVAMEQT